MNGCVEYSVDLASEHDIVVHLYTCDGDFVPGLSTRVDIVKYAKKIALEATCFEAWSGNELVGLVAMYCNAADKSAAFISNVSLLSLWQGRGIASTLMDNAIRHVRGLGFARINLEVDFRNVAALRLYARHGFVINKGGLTVLTLDL